MKIYLITMLVIYVLNICLKAVYLSGNSYPRTEEVTPAKDVFGLLLCASFAIWILALLTELNQ